MGKPACEQACEQGNRAPSTLIFVVSEKVVFSKDTCRTKQRGGQGRVERVQEMGETVETVVGWGIQVSSSFHTDVKELEYQDLLTSTFTQADHERGMKNWGAKDGYTQCVFCTHSKTQNRTPDLRPDHNGVFYPHSFFSDFINRNFFRDPCCFNKDFLSKITGMNL